MARATEKSTVTIEITGKTKEGFLITQEKEPLTFTMGDKKILDWLQKAILGMEVGESKQIELPPEKAYGDYHENLITTLKRSDFPKDLPLKVDQYYKLQDPNGGPAYASRITNIEKDTVYLDTNHPLAGKTLLFDIKLVKTT